MDAEYEQELIRKEREREDRERLEAKVHELEQILAEVKAKVETIEAFLKVHMEFDHRTSTE